MERDQDFSTNSFAWLDCSSPERWSWKTYQRSLLEGWTEYSQSWPRSGLMRNGIASQLPTLARRISGTGSSYWPTPKSSQGGPDYAKMDGRDSRQPGPGLSLPTMVAMMPDGKNWPTPRSEDSQSCGGHHGATDSLTAAVKKWPTPMASDSRGSSGNRDARTKAGRQIQLVDQVKMFPPPTARDHKSGRCSQETLDKNSRPLSEVIENKEPVGQLNPTWVELLMGFPPGWTDLSAA
jgi:hypothetical protein